MPTKQYSVRISHLYFILGIIYASGLPRVLRTSESLFETIVKLCERDFIISTHESLKFFNKSVSLQIRVLQFIARVSQFTIDEMDIFLCVIYKERDLLQNCVKYISDQNFGEQLNIMH